MNALKEYKYKRKIKELKKSIEEEKMNYEGALSEIDSVLEVLVTRINGHKTLESSIDWLLLNYPKLKSKIENREPENKNYHIEIGTIFTIKAKDGKEAEFQANALIDKFHQYINDSREFPTIKETRLNHQWISNPRQTPAESHPGRFTYLEIEAALCIWECLNDWTASNTTHKEKWKELRDNIGTVELRYQTIELAQWLIDVYNYCIECNKDIFDDMPYDWDVVPLILDHAQDEDGYPVIYKDMLPNPKDTSKKIISELNQNKWINEAINFAEKLFSYKGLITEEIEMAKKAFLQGEKPIEYVKRIGKKHDLNFNDVIKEI